MYFDFGTLYTINSVSVAKTRGTGVETKDCLAVVCRRSFLGRLQATTSYPGGISWNTGTGRT